MRTRTARRPCAACCSEAPQQKAKPKRGRPPKSRTGMGSHRCPTGGPVHHIDAPRASRARNPTSQLVAGDPAQYFHRKGWHGSSSATPPVGPAEVNLATPMIPPKVIACAPGRCLFDTVLYSAMRRPRKLVCTQPALWPTLLLLTCRQSSLP